VSIPYDKLEPPTWGGPVPEPVDRDPFTLGDVVVDPPVVLSPMAAVTNPPYRMICREMGAGLVVTEMIHARGLADGNEHCLEMLDIRPSEHPVCVQIYGKNPDEMAAGAQVVEEAGADAVDVNMGCPMRKVVSSGHGAALLQQPEKVRRIFDAMSSAVDIPVTGKIRAGWEDANAIDVGRAMADGGAVSVTIHGRTRSEKYDGHADLAVIRRLVEAVDDLAVVGNGDVKDWISARRMFSVTGCAGVMVARGALGNPWVFRELAADLRGDPVPDPPTLEEKRRTIMHHMDLYIETFGEDQTARECRKHLLWYFRGTPGEKLLRRRLADIDDRGDIEAAVAAACEACRGDETAA
jgi:tRNA-dihydrouridine synthase B